MAKLLGHRLAHSLHLLAPGGFRSIYVCIDKLSKWIKYKPLVQAIAKKAAELLDDIIHWFGLPNSIIIDLGSTFTGSDF